MTTIDASLEHLKQEKIYDHLGKVIDKVVAEKPTDAYGLVEVLSRLVKQQLPEDNYSPAPEDTEALAQYVQKLRALDKAPKEEDAPIAVCAMPDFVEEAEMLSWAGVGLGAIESYKVMCSLRNLAAKQKDAGLVKLRFWGKVFGSEADYYVAEAQRDGGGGDEGEDADPDAEPSGTGVNQYTYYVTTDLTGTWSKLPDIKPREILASRNIKRILSGNLKAKVVTHPYFDGKEEVLLRAQIARITADTVLCVNGYLKREEEDGPIEENTEFICPPSSELLKKEAWTHMQPHILNNGRTTHKELPDDTDEPNPEIEKLREEQLADPARDVLRNLTSDGLEWTIKQAGDSCFYKNPLDPSGGSKSNAVVYVRSLVWPGAVCAVRGGHFTNIYMGYGLPAGQPDFFIPAPPDVMDEPEDPGEQMEPQGTKDEEAPPAADD